MVELYSTALIATAIVIAGIIAIRAKISSSIIEVVMGVILANVLLVKIESWLEFLATFGGLTLTFLAGAEVESALLKRKAKASGIIGTLAFVAPLIAEIAFLTLITDWSWQTKFAMSLALTTTSVAVVYAVLTEYEIMRTDLGRTIVAVTFVNDILVIIGISFIQPSFNIITAIFLLTLPVLVFVIPKLVNNLILKFGKKAIEIEVRFIFAALFIVSFFADEAKMHAVFGAFVLGLIFANSLQKHQEIMGKMRTITFTVLSPAFFIKAGMLISATAVIQSAALIGGLLAVKLASKFGGCYLLCRKWIPEAPEFSTLLFSTGLTIGTIAATAARDMGVLNQTQFTVTLTAVILSAIVPTIIAKRFVPQKV
jgi:glutathione-regulated potassium-efflux system ancillary protein KefC